MAVFITGANQLTLKEFTLTNLAKDGSFEIGATSANGWTSCWDSSGFNATEHYVGSRSFKFTSGTSNLIGQSIGTPVAGHKYYGREYIKTNGNSTAADCRFELNCSDAAGMTITFGRNQGDFPNWTMISGVGEFSAVADCTLRSFSVNTENASVWIDGIVVLDLTAIFGSGNEPSKEWCDRYVEHFDGEKNVFIYTNSAGRIVGGILS